MENGLVRKQSEVFHNGEWWHLVLGQQGECNTSYLQPANHGDTHKHYFNCLTK